jgi:hypothetical protein
MTQIKTIHVDLIYLKLSMWIFIDFVISGRTQEHRRKLHFLSQVFDFATEAESARRSREDLDGLLLSFPTRPKKAGIVF